MTTMKITAYQRDKTKKAKALRKEGYVPCSIYGRHLPETLHFQIKKREADALLKKKSEGSVVEILLDETSYPALIKDVAHNFIKGETEHIAFHALVFKGDQLIQNAARVTLLNSENVPGFVVWTLREIPYESLAEHIIDEVTVDMADLQPGSRVTVADLRVSENPNLKLLVEPDSVVLRIKEPRRGAAKAEQDEKETQEE